MNNIIGQDILIVDDYIRESLSTIFKSIKCIEEDFKTLLSLQEEDFSERIRLVAMIVANSLILSLTIKQLKMFCTFLIEESINQTAIPASE